MNNSMTWVEKLYYNKTLPQKLKMTFMIFLLPVIVIFIPYLIFRGTFVLNFNVGRRFALLAAGSWSFIGPLCIQLYFRKIREFDTYVDSIKDKTEEHKNYLDDFIPLYKKLVIIISIVWGLLIVCILLFFRERMEDYAFYGFKDFYYWFIIVYCIFLAHLQAFGFAGLPLVILFLNKCFKSKTLLKRILLDDFNEGILKVGNLIVLTCICFGTGALYFPILISFSRDESTLIKYASYGLVIIFAFALFTFFVISFLIIRGFAKKAKNEIVDEVRDIYGERLKEAIKNRDLDNLSGIKNELNISNLHDRINDLEKININPVDIQGISATVITIFIPVILYLKDIFEFLKNVL